ncbi:MAG: hypothetical protein ACREBR_04695 [bacterium]
MQKFIKSLKKLSPKEGDIILVTLKGYPTSMQVEKVKDGFFAMPFLKGVNLIFTTDKIIVKKSKPKDGKHQVFLNNLEYLEYMSKPKGESQ